LPDDLHALDGLLVSSPRPDHGTFRYLIDVGHLQNLLTVFLKVLLINAYCVNPELMPLYFVTKILQCACKVLGDGDDLISRGASIDGRRILGASPNVRKCFVSRSIASLDLDRVEQNPILLLSETDTGNKVRTLILLALLFRGKYW